MNLNECSEHACDPVDTNKLKYHLLMHLMRFSHANISKFLAGSVIQAFMVSTTLQTLFFSVKIPRRSNLELEILNINFFRKT